MHVQNSYLSSLDFVRATAPEHERGRYRDETLDGAPRMEGTGILIGLVLSLPLWCGIGWAVFAVVR